MKRFAAIITTLALFLPFTAYAAAFPTQSLHLVAASSQFASITNASQTGLGITGDMTIEGWVKPASQPTSGHSFVIAGKWTETANQMSYRFDYDNVGGTMKLGFYETADGSTAKQMLINQTLSNGTWYHVAVSYVASTGIATFIVNGSSIGTASGGDASIFNGTSKFQVGADNEIHGSGVDFAFWDGNISMARVWNTAVSASTVNTNKCTNFGSAQTNLQAEWSFDNVYTDTSGNANTLTGSGSPTFQTDVTSGCAVAASSFQLWPFSLF